MTDGDGKGQSRRHKRRSEARPEGTDPRTGKAAAAKICRKCGGRMYPADWIWQKYGLCVGWRCSQCKEKVMARSLPFKGLRKRTLDPDEAADLGKTAPAPAAEVRPETGAKRPPRPQRPPRGRR
jgi:hypothetical protein